jgi:hypothetical protein
VEIIVHLRRRCSTYSFRLSHIVSLMMARLIYSILRYLEDVESALPEYVRVLPVQQVLCRRQEELLYVVRGGLHVPG